MASNNNGYGQGFSNNPQLAPQPPYQIPRYQTQAMGGMPQQNPIYNLPQAQSMIHNPRMPPMQGYVPASMPVQNQSQYHPGYQTSPLQPQMQYQSQHYQQPYIQQPPQPSPQQQQQQRQIYQQQTNRAGYQNNQFVATSPQTYQHPGLPRPHNKPASHVPDPSAHPQHVQHPPQRSHDVLTPRQQHQQIPVVTPMSAPVRPPSVPSNQPSEMARPPSAGPRPPSAGPRPPFATPRRPYDATSRHPSDASVNLSTTHKHPSDASAYSSAPPRHPKDAYAHPVTIPRPQSATLRPPIATVKPTPIPSKPVTPQQPVPVTPTATVSGRSSQSDLPVDYQVLLLALADEYINKAHGMSAMLVRSMQDADLEQYQKLIAAGLGCIESVLRNFKFPDPRIEARLVHRYCSLLLDETENESEAHEMLSKTIRLCERHRLVDLRYSLINVQLRFHLKFRPGAALKMLDGILELVETYKHVSWNYAMRFLRVSLALQASQLDMPVALQHLRRISQLAQSHHHIPILAASAAFEALVHLKSDSQEAVQSAQSALADARKHQLDPSLQNIPQLAAMLDCLDLCCDLIRFSPEQAVMKMKQMQKVMDEASSNKSWRADGSFCVPIDGAADAVDQDIRVDSGGLFERTSKGQRALVLTWIKKSELFALGYLFSGMATAHKNSHDRKSERYLEEGSKISTAKYNDPDEQKMLSLKNAHAQAERKAYFHQATILHLILVRCNRYEWAAAEQALRPFVDNLGLGARQFSTNSLDLLTIYLSGVIKQGTGDLTGALADYQSPVLQLSTATPQRSSIPNTTTTTAASISPNNSVAHDLQLLATLNTILILRPDPFQSNHILTLLPTLERACLSHADKSFHAAYNLVLVTCSPHLPISRTKQLLSIAMANAKKVANEQCKTIDMSLMNATFFQGIVGDSPVHSAKVAVTLARRCANPLWISVAAGLLGQACDNNGIKEGAMAALEEGQRNVGSVPETVRRTFGQRSLAG